MKYYLQKIIIKNKTYLKYEIDPKTTEKELYNFLIDNQNIIQLVYECKRNSTEKTEKTYYGFYKICKYAEKENFRGLIKVTKITTDTYLPEFLGFLIKNIIEKRNIIIIKNYDNYYNNEKNI